MHDSRRSSAGTADETALSRSKRQEPGQGVQWMEVSEHEDGQRVDNFLLRRLKGLPRSHLYRLIRKGQIRVNKKRCKPDTRLGIGDVLRVAPLRLDRTEAPAVPGRSLQQLLQASVLYQDDSLLVLNKPAGVAVHAGSGTAVGIIEALRYMAGDGAYRELVHRLDKETSGCLLVACHGKALKVLQRSLKQKNMQKIYLALVHGQWPDSLEEIDVPLKKLQPTEGEAIVKTASDGKSALTRFVKLGDGQQSSLIQAGPVTGRTHQIRVHCQYAGHAIVGDDKYTHHEAGQLANVRHLNLHAAALGFEHPVTGVFQWVSAPLRQEMLKLLQQQGIACPPPEMLIPSV